MIYILGIDYIYEGSYLEDVIEIVSTNIEHILEYLYNNVKTDYITEYSILVKPENDYYSYETIYPNVDAYNSFIQYTPHIFSLEENKKEYEHVKNQLLHWCNAIKKKRETEKAERELANREMQEKQERELYEKLKAKFGD